MNSTEKSIVETCLWAFNMLAISLFCLSGCGSASTPPPKIVPAMTSTQFDDGKVVISILYPSDFKIWVEQNKDVIMHSVSYNHGEYIILYTPAKKPAEKVESNQEK